MPKLKNVERQAKAAHLRILAWTRSAGAKCALALFIGAVMMGLVLSLVSAPQRYSLTVGTISRQTINATKDVVDELTTEERRAAAAAAVEPSYHLAEGVSDAVMTKLSALFDELRSVQQLGLGLREASGENVSAASFDFSDDVVNEAIGMVTGMTLSKYQALLILRTETVDFDTMVNSVTRAVSNAMNTGIREGKVADAVSTVQSLVGYQVNISLNQLMVPYILRNCLSPNLVIDQDTTETARQRARDAVEPVVYQQGQNILREGDVVQPNQLQMVKALGLLQDDSYDLYVYLGIALLMVTSTAVLVILIALMQPELLRDLRKTIVITGVLVVHVTICALTQLLTPTWFMPLAMGGMLLTALLGWRIGLAATISLSITLVGLVAGDSSASLTEMMYVLLMTLSGGIVAIRILHGKPQRMRMLLSGFLAGLVSAAAIVTLGWMTSLDVTSAWQNALWSLGGGLLAGVIATALQPVFEAIFNLATPSKLLELGNPNHPLLRRLLLEASGTYHHSIIVANLAEAAAEKIGANPLLARTGAYFHDVGKLKRPQYFKENQMGENPLNETDPYVSAAIVTSHTRDGLVLAQKYRLPAEIQEIIIQHHGDTPVMYFYHKACQMAGDKPVDISDFRYDGVRPTTKEAAIVMMADTVEAAVRSMPDPTPESIREKIDQLIRGKLDDGQLSNSPMTLRDIDNVCEAFMQVLNGVFHERIEYPDAKIPQRGAFMTEASSDKQQNAAEKENKA